MSVSTVIAPYGPAIWGGCVTRRRHRAESCYFSREAVTVQALPAGRQGGYGTCFCCHDTNLIECWRDRGTSLIGATNLSPVTNLETGNGAESRYKLSRSQKLVTVQDFNCVQMRALPTEAERRWVSGCNNHYEFVLRAGAKAKSVTNNLPILSVLAEVLSPITHLYIYHPLSLSKSCYLELVQYKIRLHF